MEAVKLGSKFLVLVSAVALTAGCNKSSDSGSTAAAVGKGATLTCAGGKNAFSTYGTNAFVAVNESIFTNVSNEVTAHGTTNLGNSFTLIGSGTPASTSDGVAAFKGKLAAFLVFTYGGPATITYTDNQSYAGSTQDMTVAHTGLNITSAQYTYFVNNIVVPALTSNGVPSADVTNCFAPPLLDSTFIASIVNH